MIPPPMTTPLAHGPLRDILEVARAEEKCSRDALTVLGTDPYRIDTPANRRDGAWVAEQLERAIGAHRHIHWRGLHYAIVAAGDVIQAERRALPQHGRGLGLVVGIRWKGGALALLHPVRAHRRQQELRPGHPSEA